MHRLLFPMTFTRLIGMISKFLEDPALCALLCDSSDSTPYPGGNPSDMRYQVRSTLEAGTFVPQSTARRSPHRPCPDCGSRLIRSRDLREMCVVCGYLQTHA
jgi:hypothetical protein